MTEPMGPIEPAEAIRKLRTILQPAIEWHRLHDDDPDLQYDETWTQVEKLSRGAVDAIVGIVRAAVVPDEHTPLEPTGTCRSCNAEVHWICFQGTGKKNPLDLDPRPDGNVILTDRIAVDGTPGARVLTKKELEQPDMFSPDLAHTPRYVSHFATCPNAKDHRKTSAANTERTEP